MRYMPQGTKKTETVCKNFRNLSDCKMCFQKRSNTHSYFSLGGSIPKRNIFDPLLLNCMSSGNLVGSFVAKNQFILYHITPYHAIGLLRKCLQKLLTNFDQGYFKTISQIFSDLYSSKTGKKGRKKA